LIEFSNVTWVGILPTLFFTFDSKGEISTITKLLKKKNHSHLVDKTLKQNDSNHLYQQK